MTKLMDKDGAVFSGIGFTLSASGAFRVALLMKVCSSHSGRVALSKKSGIDSTLLLKWVKMAERRAVDSGGSIYLLKISDVKAIRKDLIRGVEHPTIKTGGSRSDMK